MAGGESGFFNQPVTHARLGDEMFGLRGVGLQFLAQMRDVDAQVMRLFHRLRPPNFRQQLAVRQNLAGVLHEQSQQCS